MLENTATPERMWSSRKIIWLGKVLRKFFIGVVGLVGAVWWIGGPVIPATTLKALRGKTQDDVRRVLGKPAKVMPYGDWIYDRVLNPGYVAISFDDDGQVRSVNDEQADPVTFGSGSWYK
jgi:hypothetical protein